ncbi:K+-transporting ATPase ATPase C chain [Tumebacillus sp. BK434]|uniref:potassium-transporting ATPase subunit KdpC n=1 Tax=Tumebacillus sp. BK434 TaxID=2512169 RepID=UPI001051B81E|nr:potassium-transporting ATPase subunit KdpC [Tumebacillus sp. BK434]TCP58152.1 K+-transporting ATPase ATPase C chain [Tumebacillus sp. BK434]
MKGITIMFRLSSVLMIVCGLLYPLSVTGVAQTLLPDQAKGSLVYNDQQEVIGSKLIGQTFASPQYFHGRISSIGYDAAASGSPNYAPSNPELIRRTEAAVSQWKEDNPEVPVDRLPADLVTNSGSGLDPHISPAAALAQVPRVSQQTGLDEAELKRLIDANTDRPLWGIFGEPGVNVLLLNLAVNKQRES